MTMVNDTNVLVPALDESHAYAAIIDGWIHGRYQWAVSTDILLESQEVITRMLGQARWRKLSLLMDIVDAADASLIRVSPWFRFRAIPHDWDDDKFADCAITAQAKHVITQDRHFRTLSGAGYRPQPIRAEEFIRCYLAM